MFINANVNPASNIVGDCTVRAIAFATNQDWDSVYLWLCLQGYVMKDMPNSNNVWGVYLRTRGFERHIIPNTCPDCYTVRDFCKDNPKGAFVLATGSHVIAVVNGDYYDTWDSGDEVPIYFWSKGD
jgi:hypothetical protein